MSKSRISLALTLLLLLLGALSTLVAAQANGYRVDWWTLDNGGGASAAGRYTVTGAIGQPDASAAMQGGVYCVTGGHWGAAGSYKVFLPLILRE